MPDAQDPLERVGDGVSLASIWKENIRRYIPKNGYALAPIKVHSTGCQLSVGNMAVIASTAVQY